MALKLKSPGSGLENLSLPGKLAVGLVFTVMVAAAYFVVFYGEVESNISAQYQLLQQKRAELEKAEEAKKLYNKDLAEKARREQLALKQKKILPDSSESPAFLSTVQTVATISGIKLTRWTPLDEEPQEFYAKVPMQLALEGKFHQIAKFFHGVGQVDRIINMENIVIQVLPDKSKSKSKQLSPGEETVQVEVECLATAFRALRSDEGGGGRKRKGAGRGKPGAKPRKGAKK
jgi:type IV pilus assembly protein PilO